MIKSLRRQLGVTPQTVVVVVIIAAVAVYYVVELALSPDSVTIAGPSTIPMGQSGSFTATVRFSDTSTADRTIYINFYEDENIGNVGLEKDELLTIPAGKTSGSKTVQLECTSDGLSGDDGTSSTADEYHVYAMYDRAFPLTNVESSNQEAECIEG